MTAQLDETIHQAMRLRIMATLNALPQGEQLEFTRLRALLAATDGNLGAHLSTLERAGYVTIDKRFDDRKPRTSVSMSPKGRSAYASHVSFLKRIIEG
jgi:DNA-binding MarR family transcriptional regulator